MIVIAIIGILAAIAIPNFIAYRNKAFCSATESDANTIAGCRGRLLFHPGQFDHILVRLTGTNASRQVYVATLLSNRNTWTIRAADPTAAITIKVTDASRRCPQDYQQAMDSANDPRSFWDSNFVYSKVVAQ